MTKKVLKSLSIKDIEALKDYYSIYSISIWLLLLDEYLNRMENESLGN